MILEIIRSMLGPFNAVLDFFSAHPGYLMYLLTAWAGLYLAGTVQLRRIEARTIALLIRYSQSPGAQADRVSAVELYRQFYPVWRQELEQWNYWFIPHQNDLWPVRVSPERVAAKIPLSPDWLEKTLNKHGMVLSDPGSEPERKNQIA
jgi:hypothetical protein